MVDMWFFDCAPCGIQEPYETANEAIQAAEAHIWANHPHMSSHELGQNRIGIVQQRTVTTPEDVSTKAPAQSPTGTGEAGTVLPGDGEATPAPLATDEDPMHEGGEDRVKE